MTPEQREKLNTLQGNIEEMRKCEADPLYFFNTYCLVDGKSPNFTQEQYDAHVKAVMGIRNRRRPSRIYHYPIRPEDCI